MNSSGASIAAAEASLKKQAGAIEKLFKSIKKLFAKEFLWVLLIVLISFPLTLIAYHVITQYSAPEFKKSLEDIFKESGLFIGLYALNMAGLYFTRTLLGAIKTLSKS